MNDLLSPTIFREECKDATSTSSVKESDVKNAGQNKSPVELAEEAKERTVSLPRVPPREYQKTHVYTEIPEPGDLLKNKALSTGKNVKS